MLCDDLNWIKRAKDGDTFDVDIAFVYSNTWRGEASTILLSKPSFVKGRYMRTADAICRSDELVSYYREWLAISKKKWPNQREYFWIRPIISGKKDSITFPWTDSYSECRSWADKVTAKGDGELFWDCDQGWEVAFYGKGNAVFAAQSEGPEATKLCAAYRFTRLPFQEKVRSALDRAASLVKLLNSKLQRKIFT